MKPVFQRAPEQTQRIKDHLLPPGMSYSLMEKNVASYKVGILVVVNGVDLLISLGLHRCFSLLACIKYLD